LLYDSGLIVKDSAANFASSLFFRIYGKAKKIDFCGHVLLQGMVQVKSINNKYSSAHISLIIETRRIVTRRGPASVPAGDEFPGNLYEAHNCVSSVQCFPDSSILSFEEGMTMLNVAGERVLAGKTIMVVDDETAVRDVLEAFLSELEVIVIPVKSVSQARDYLKTSTVDVILSDIAMPGGETGIDLLRWCRSNLIAAPFIFISGFVTPDDVRFALSQGVQHVINKPFRKQQLIEAMLSSFAVSDSYGNLVNSYLEQIERNQQLFMATVDGFAAAVGARDGYTFHHSRQVAEFAVLLSKKIGLDDKNVQAAKIAGQLHDIGKIGVPENILLKEIALTVSEYAVMKTHPEKTAEILSPVPSLAAVIDGARHHHEKYDGTGYPDGLKGEFIPLLGRILAICDAFSAMITERPYRSAITAEMAREQIRINSSTQFDPHLAIVFLSLPEILEM
jgi:putative two-component system response regulator